MKYRVKSGIFGQTAKFRQRPCLFHILNIGIKVDLTKQTLKNPDETAHKELFANVCPNLPDVRSNLTLCYDISLFLLFTKV